MVAKALQMEPTPFKYNIVIIKMRKEEFSVAKRHYSVISIMIINNKFLDMLKHNRNNSHVKCVIKQK
jgi:hypothetical protein